MKKLLSLILIFAVCMWAGAVGAVAMRAPLFAGDADADGNITISDATAVQKHCAGIIEFDLLSSILADADNDSRITVKDATAVQKYLAKIEKHSGECVYPYIYCREIYSDYSSGKAMTGVPVTFTADCGNYDERANPVVYGLYIDGKLYGEENETGVFTCTFDEAGDYNVSIKAHNSFGNWEEFCVDQAFTVVEPYESDVPVVKAFYSHYYPWLGGNSYHEAEENVTLEAEVIFGSGDYKYAFYLDGKLLRDYSDDNTYTFEKLPEARDKEYTLRVHVKDSSTGDSYVYEDYIFNVNY